MEYKKELAKNLILEELFDYTLYQRLQAISTGAPRVMLDKLVAIGAGHVAFWKDFFHWDIRQLPAGARIRLFLIVLACRIFGAPAIHLTLEAVEIHGIRNYLAL